MGTILDSNELKALMREAVGESLREHAPMFLAAAKEDLARESRPRPVLNSEQAALLAGVKRRTIQKWVRDRRLTPLGKSPYRFTEESVLAARDRRTVGLSNVDIEQRADELLARRKKGGKR